MTVSPLTRTQKRSLIALLAILFVDNLALAIVYPLFTLLILTPTSTLLPLDFSLSFRLLLLALLIASFPFAQFLGGPIIGHLADTKTRKGTFLVTLIGETIGFILSALAMAQFNYPLLLISRIITGFFAGNLLLCLTSIADLSSDREQRAHHFGLVATFAGAGFVIAIMIGGLLSNATLDALFSTSFPFILSGAFSLTNIALLLKCYTETKKEDKLTICGIKGHCYQLISIFKTKKLGSLCTTFFFFMLGWTITLQFLPTLLLEHFSAKKMVITFTFIGIGVVWCVSNTLINRLLVYRFRSTSILLIGLIISTFSLAVLSQSHSLTLFFHLILIASLFASLTWTNCLATISNSAPIYLQGKLLGITQSIAALAMIFSPLFAGMLGAYDIWTIYIAAASSSLLSTLVLIFHLKH